MWRRDGQNYDPYDCTSIAASCGKKIYFKFVCLVYCRQRAVKKFYIGAQLHPIHCLVPAVNLVWVSISIKLTNVIRFLALLIYICPFMMFPQSAIQNFVYRCTGNIISVLMIKVWSRAHQNVRQILPKFENFYLILQHLWRHLICILWVRIFLLVKTLKLHQNRPINGASITLRISAAHMLWGRNVTDKQTSKQKSLHVR